MRRKEGATRLVGHLGASHNESMRLLADECHDYTVRWSSVTAGM